MLETNDGNKKQNFVDSDDPTFLAVKGYFENKIEAKNYIKNLAKAILVVYQKHNKVNLRCVGAASVNNATKALARARDESKLNLVSAPSFTSVTFDGDVDRTAIVSTVTCCKCNE
ncbi:MAG: stage V sporulation protein S [Candidatus Staskawiczbacteria bacterium]|nr:stage V sporulation protein S [Candidatus Staskawiczbacteria bacterium]